MPRLTRKERKLLLDMLKSGNETSVILKRIKTTPEIVNYYKKNLEGGKYEESETENKVNDEIKNKSDGLPIAPMGQISQIKEDLKPDNEVIEDKDILTIKCSCGHEIIKVPVTCRGCGGVIKW